jgi:hypothetical protein
MTRTYSFAVADARNDAVETAIGTAPKFRLYSGTMPTNARTALSGNTLLAEGALPSDWMSASAGGVKAKTGTWTLTGQAGAGGGTAATFYRIYDTAGTNCHEQGTVTATGGGGDATMDNTSVANAQSITVNTFQKTDGNL